MATSISDNPSRTNKVILIIGCSLLILGAALLFLAGWIESGDFGRLRQLQGLVMWDVGTVSIVLGIVMAVSSIFYRLPVVRWTYLKLVVPLLLISVSTIVALIFIELTLNLMYRDIQVGGSDSPSGRTFYPKYYV